MFSACEKKEQQQSAPAAPGEVATTPAPVATPAETPAPVAKALTPGERAAMLGIVGQLSKDTEGVLAIYDGKEIVKRLKSLKTWEYIRDMAKEEGGVDPEEEMAAGAEEAGKFLGQEIFIATGKGTTPQVENLMKFSRRNTYYQMRVMTRAFAAAAQEGDISALESASQGAMMEMAKELGKEMGLVESAAMPPVLVGVKAQDAEALKTAQGQLDEMFAGIPDGVGEAAKPLEFTKGGVAFKGYKLAGSFLAEQLEATREEIEELLEPADVDRLIAALKLKNLAIAHGSVGNYLMLFVGDNEEACPLVDKVEDSLAANDSISFVDGYKDKKLAGFIYAEQGLTKSAVAGSLKDMALGVRDGLAGAEGFGDTRELASLLGMVGDKEDALLGMAKADTTGGLVVLEDGVKFETFGGVDRGAVDHAASHQLANLGTKDEVLLFANWVANPEYSKRAREYGEAIVESAYAMAEKVAGLELDDSGEFEQFKGGFALFDEKFRTDAVAAWDALATADSGLGDETAIVVDLKGAMPPLPGIPQELVDGGRFLRASAVSPVTDREKLKESWTKLDASLKNIFKTASELAGEDIPMQKPMPSKEGDFTTWFFSMVSFDDFVPSVTLNDKWLVASTSRSHALELAAAADKAAGDRKGAWMELDFDVLRKFTTEWLALVEKNGEAVLGGAEQLAAFQEQLPRIRKGLAALEEFDQLSYSERREGGKLRSTLHFKTR